MEISANMRGTAASEGDPMSASEKSEWQSKILLELAFFLRGFPETPSADWRVKRPTMSAYRAAVDLVTGIDVLDLPQPRMAPDREGGIQFEWDTLEVGISPSGAFESLQVTPDGRSQEGAVAISKARRLIAGLARR